MPMPSTHVRFAQSMFGLQERARAGADRRRRDMARALATTLDRSLQRSCVALVTGPSGSGKSMTVRALCDRLRASGRPMVVVTPDASDRATLDRVMEELELARPADVLCAMRDENEDRATLVQTLRILARAGLAEARLLGRPAHALSDGQRARLAIALGMASATGSAASAGPVTVVADEFCSVLDRTTAACVAHAVARWCRSTPGVRLVCATAHDDVLEALAPDVLVHVPLVGPGRVLSRTPREACR